MHPKPPKPHDLVDLRLAPVAIQVDERLEELGRLTPEQLENRLALDNNGLSPTRERREQDALYSATRLLELSGWQESWHDRGVRLSHGQHSLVLGAPATLRAYVATGSAAGSETSASV